MSKYFKSFQMMMELLRKRFCLKKNGLTMTGKYEVNCDNNLQKTKMQELSFFSWGRYSRFSWNYNEIEFFYCLQTSLNYTFLVHLISSEEKVFKMEENENFLLLVRSDFFCSFFPQIETSKCEVCKLFVVLFDFLFNNS
jgi:hypothetical protein